MTISNAPKVFYVMPFSGRSYEEIVSFRQGLHGLASNHGVQLLEQFIGVEEKGLYETHGYLPLFIAGKDFDFVREADILIADYSGGSIGRDVEVVLAKEILDKRTIAIVPDAECAQRIADHPYVRLYSNYIVRTVEEAFSLAGSLGNFPLSQKISALSRVQKDRIDVLLQNEARTGGIDAIERLLPSELRRRWKDLFGTEYTRVLGTSFDEYPVTLRINPILWNRAAFERFCQYNSLSYESVEFSEYVFRMGRSASHETIRKTPEYAAGNYYIQELSSLLSPIALNPQPGEKILDLCAAPGSKTTQMAEMMRDEGEILAVDISPERMSILRAAVKRQGLSIITPLTGESEAIGDTHPEFFDRVLVDGPCSCEGIFRYKAHKFFEWDFALLPKLIDMQKRILESGYRALKPGGELLYSTCTFAPEENEGVVYWLFKRYSSATVRRPEFPGVAVRPALLKWGHWRYDGRISNCVRLYPHDNDTIGFFIALIVKELK